MVSDSTMAVGASELENGDAVWVHVNRRASGHLGKSRIRAVVNWVGGLGDSVQFKDVDTEELHTWYADIGYIHGYHTELERRSDIGKVTKVERRDE